MSQIKFVLFDVGNVVVRATHEITYAILRDYGIAPEAAQRFYQNKDYADFARGKITSSEFVDRLMGEHLQNKFLGYHELCIAHDAHIYAVDPLVVEVLKELKALRVLLGFVTNTNKWQTLRELQLINLEKEFARVVRSHDIGMIKTDEGAWPAILKKFGCQNEDPSTILLVDDSVVNCEAASRAGLQVHQYDPTLAVGVTKLRAALLNYGLPLRFR